MSLSRPKRTVGVSLKLYFSLSQTQAYIKSCIPLATRACSQPFPIDIFIIPDFLALPAASEALQETGSWIGLGAQDCFWEDGGAFTGSFFLGMKGEGNADDCGG